MNSIVCVKQVPSTTEVVMDPITHTIVRNGRQSVLNPFDIVAVELAVRLKEAYGGNVTALSMGIPETEVLLGDTIARGADSAVLLTDKRFAGADTLATSYALSLGIRSIGGYDLILCGKMAVDGDTAQIGPELAEQLGLPHVTDVLSVDDALRNALVVTQRTDDGTRTVRVSLPCVLTVSREAAEVRYPTVSGILHSLTVDVNVLDADTIGADPQRIGLAGSPTQVVSTYVPEKAKQTEYLNGEAEQLIEPFLQLIEKFGGKGA